MIRITNTMLNYYTEPDLGVELAEIRNVANCRLRINTDNNKVPGSMISVHTPVNNLKSFFAIPYSYIQQGEKWSEAIIHLISFPRAKIRLHHDH